ncbi:alpha/beta hydrolase [Arthrobacter sp. 260]|uniref:alpha/beta hydrolase n=1 Tax=Arthrobacter sp. 260 TaxID=2735314 RepID=UPI001492983E|nr:alpha/beta hydrolase [Arthrobacter sp. 260]NOJ58362.1 alpha/beta hydrolase [Arthrobacter sp. 260]
MPTDAPPPARRTKRRRLRRVLTVLVLVFLAVVVAAAAVVLTPSPAEETTEEAVRADPAVQVLDRDGYLAVLPAGTTPETGIIFYPGARATPEGYLASWAPIVEATGVAVYLAEMPFGFASLRDDAAAGIVAAEPDVTSWWIGGHSLGGITAAHYFDTHPEFEGLLLWAAFPDDEVVLTGAAGREVLAVTGSRDGIVPTQVVKERLADAGISADVVEIEGMEHSQFGAYRSIFGDGDPTISDEAARLALAQVTTDFLQATGQHPAG